MELETWKKLFKGWTASFEVCVQFGVRRRGGQRKGGRQAGDAGAQISIGIEAERLGSGNPKAQRSKADGKAHSKTKFKKTKRGEN